MLAQSLSMDVSNQSEKASFKDVDTLYVWENDLLIRSQAPGEKQGAKEARELRNYREPAGNTVKDF